MSKRHLIAKQYIRKLVMDLKKKESWKSNAEDRAFLNGIILCDFVLNGEEFFKEGSKPPFLEANHPLIT